LLLAGVALTLASLARAETPRTDLGKALVPLDEIVSGGPPPDGIPAIDRPRFVDPAAADRWLMPSEPVLAPRIGGDARAYPLRILMWHEIVNDTVGGRPVAVTYCPLCNSGLVFERVAGTTTLDFGTSGKLYKSDLVMYDRQTHSLWAQMEGRAIVGALAGTRLALLPANTLAWEDFKAAYPGGTVLSQESGHSRPYGRNPYEAYARLESRPFLFHGVPDSRLPPKERVVGVVVASAQRAYPWCALARERVIHDALGGTFLVILYRPWALSAHDASCMTESRAIDATAAFSRVPDGERLGFEPVAEGFRDRQTGSLWTILGEARQGPLAGRRLAPIAHADAFWFAWTAFHPATSIHSAP
jgi:hypothetical protein